MHDLDPIFRGWSRSPKVAQLLQDLGFQQPLPVQSMLILKVRMSYTRQMAGHRHSFACACTARQVSTAHTWLWCLHEAMGIAA